MFRCILAKQIFVATFYDSFCLASNIPQICLSRRAEPRWLRYFVSPVREDRKANARRAKLTKLGWWCLSGVCKMISNLMKSEWSPNWLEQTTRTCVAENETVQYMLHTCELCCCTSNASSTTASPNLAMLPQAQPFVLTLETLYYLLNKKFLRYLECKVCLVLVL